LILLKLNDKLKHSKNYFLEAINTTPEEQMNQILSILILFVCLALHAEEKTITAQKYKFNYNIKNFDLLPYPQDKLTEKEIGSHIEALLNAKGKEQTKIAKKLLIHGKYTIDYVYLSMSNPDLSADRKQCLKQLVCDMWVVNARRKLLNPQRQNIEIKDIGALEAIEIIKKQYGWNVDPIHKTDRKLIKYIHVTISLKDASLIDAISALCNQTGLSMYRNIDYVGIFGASDKRESGGKNLTFSSGGFCFNLSFDNNVFSINKDATPSYSVSLRTISNVNWFTFSDPVFKFDIFDYLYPDGESLNLKPVEGWIMIRELPVRDLAVNGGLISKVKGVVSLNLPLSVNLHEINLKEKNIQHNIKDGNSFLEIKEFIQYENCWMLAYEHGYYGDPRTGTSGFVEILDDNLKITEGKFLSSGGGGGYRNSKKYESDTAYTRFNEKPYKLRWIITTETEKRIIPIAYSNLRVPDIIWQKELAKIAHLKRFRYDYSRKTKEK
jgi:hypothetical protein